MFAKLLSRIENKARLMGAMMAHVDVDPVAASRVRGGTALTAAWRRCMACQREKDCAAWLAGSSATAAEPPSFCPNADFLAENGVRPASWPTAPLGIAAESPKAATASATGIQREQRLL